MLSAFSSRWHESHPEVRTLEMSELEVFRPYRGQDVALVRLDIDADLRSVWNWNVKQLFVYVVAEYTSPTHAHNEVVIWDEIVESEEDSLLQLRGERVKYPLRDYGTDLRGADVKLSLLYDVMPITGSMVIKKKDGKGFVVPREYQLGEGERDGGSDHAR